MTEVTGNVLALYNKFYDGTGLTDEERTFDKSNFPTSILILTGSLPASPYVSKNIATYLNYLSSSVNVGDVNPENVAPALSPALTGRINKNVLKELFGLRKKELDLAKAILGFTQTQQDTLFGAISNPVQNAATRNTNITEIKNALPAIEAAYNTARQNYFNLREELVRAYHPDTDSTDGIENEVESFRARRITLEQFETIFNNYVEKYKNNLKAMRDRLNYVTAFTNSTCTYRTDANRNQVTVTEGIELLSNLLEVSGEGINTGVTVSNVDPTGTSGAGTFNLVRTGNNQTTGTGTITNGTLTFKSDAASWVSSVSGTGALDWNTAKINERDNIAKNLRISETVVLYLILEFQQITRELVEEISDYNAPGPSETYELSSEEIAELEKDTKYKIAKNKQNLENKRRGKFYMISILTAINFILLFLTIFLIFNV